MTYVQNFAADCYIDGRFVLIVVCEEVWVSRQQELQAESVAVLGTEMAWGVAVNILGIYVCTNHQNRLYNTQIASNTSDMQRCSEIP